MHSFVHMHNGGSGGRLLWEIAEKRLFSVLKKGNRDDIS